MGEGGADFCPAVGFLAVALVLLHCKYVEVGGHRVGRRRRGGRWDQVSLGGVAVVHGRVLVGKGSDGDGVDRSRADGLGNMWWVYSVMDAPQY